MTFDTIELMNHLGIERAHLIGMSLGGMIAQRLVLDHPRRVRSVALLMTTPGLSDPRLSPSDPRVIETALRPASTADEIARRAADLSDLLAGERFPADPLAEAAAEAAERARGTNPDNEHGRVAMQAPSRLDALTGVQVPALVVNGGSDPIFPPDHARALAAALPNSVHVEWEGVGHQLPEAMLPELINELSHLVDRAS